MYASRFVNSLLKIKPRGTTNVLHMINKTTEVFDEKIKVIDDKGEKLD